jgi:hypothetical protein
LVVSADAIEQADELLRRDGMPESVLVASAAPEYFDWMTAPEFESGELARPANEVLLLYSPSQNADSRPYPLPELVFFRKEDGWKSVTPVCCRGIDVSAR